MAVSDLRYWVLVLAIFVLPNCTEGQAFFKILENPDDFYNQKIHRFSNGDILLGDSSLESLHEGGLNGEVYLTRFYECGDKKWSFGYHVDEGYLEFRDFVMNDDEEVFVYGSYFIDLQESIFLLKVDGNNGDLIDFKLYNPSTVDHFTYTIDIQDNRLMVYGLLLDFNTQKRGFVAFFSSKLSFEEARTFIPFESTGAAYFTTSSEIIGRSGPYHFLLDEDIGYKWAFTIEDGGSIQVIGGPYNVDDGYIFEAHTDGMSFFYRISSSGRLEWKSELFQSSGNRVVISQLPEGTFLGTYSYPSGESTLLSQLILSRDGEISGQRTLSLNSSVVIGDLSQSVSSNNTVTIAANTDPFSLFAPDIKDFVLQYYGDEESECLLWDSSDELFSNELNLVLEPYNFEVESLVMTQEEEVRARVINFSFPLSEFCDETIPVEELVEVNTLDCHEDWEVFLPNEDFQWDDINGSDARVLSEPGSYTARKIRCVEPIVLEYILEKPDCDCNVYIPNVIMKTGVNRNQVLTIESDCTFIDLNMSIYNRWGQLIHNDHRADASWNPFSNQSVTYEGVFVCVLEYEIIDINGNQTTGIAVQDLTLIQ